MGLRFQRRVRLFPGCHLNVSGSGVGVSIGSRGAHVGIDARGRRYASAGLPGTGLSWREYERKPANRPQPCDLCQEGHAHISPWLVILGLVAIGFILLAVLSR